MPVELIFLTSLMRYQWGRLMEARQDQRGMTTETVIITAVLAGLAIAVTLIIADKVTNKATSIRTE